MVGFARHDGQCLRVRDDTRSVSARSTPEVTKVTWMMTLHLRAASSSGPSPILIKLRNSEIADIATIEDINFSFRPVKSTVPIQAGRSRFPASSLETKFS